MIRGPWLHTILFEIPVLAIVNEVYFRATQKAPDFVEGRRRLREKIALIAQNPAMEGVRIADYGTRRRFSRLWHEEVIVVLREGLGDNLAGSSNVMYAARHGLTPLGTMAHEYLQACQALGPRLRDSQTFGFETWAREYRGDLGIALSDVYGMNAFLRDFDLYFCKLFDGARHDSGDPMEWGERLIAHYERNRVDPRTKTIVFSDSLTIPKVIELYQRFRERARIAFGVGTNLTNDLGLHAAADRDQDGPLQRAARREAVGLARQEHVRRRCVPGLPAPGVRDHATGSQGRDEARPISPRAPDARADAPRADGQPHAPARWPQPVGQARRLHGTGHRRQQDPQAGVPDRRGAGEEGGRRHHAGRDPVEPRTADGRGRRQVRHGVRDPPRGSHRLHARGLPESGNVILDRLLGANIRHVPAGTDMDAAMAKLAAELVRRGPPAVRDPGRRLQSRRRARLRHVRARTRRAGENGRARHRPAGARHREHRNAGRAARGPRRLSRGDSGARASACARRSRCRRTRCIRSPHARPNCSACRAR